MPLHHFALLLLMIISGLGCSRTRYRTAADRDSYSIVREKAVQLTHPIPQNYTVRPDPRARFYDPTNPDCPQLPVPRPVLRGYDLPELASDVGCPDPSCIRPWVAEAMNGPVNQGLEITSAGPAIPNGALAVGPPAQGQTTELIVPLRSNAPVIDTGLQGVASDPVSGDHNVVAASYAANVFSLIQSATPPALLPTPSTNQPKMPAKPGAGFKKATIPQRAWEVLPTNCIDRVLEFPSMRDEYSASYPGTVVEKLVPDVRRLSLANLMELASINSREFQLRKEVLFRAALVLTRQRYLFELQPIPFGNGSSLNYRHLRQGGVEQNTLAVPTGVGVQKTLATGGQFLAQFANSVVLTFNGPNGFATDIGSQLLFDFQQSLFQRDIRFENLTQAERDVVYAARDYIRFRKQLFRDVSGSYYNLLVSFRGIEINAQDYFTNLRGFLQSQAEYRTAEKIPRIQVDQFEQNVLRTRSNLVNNCFALEAALDQLKFRLGLPTEMPIHLNLGELESISLKDELSVARQMINRARTELVNSRNSATSDITTLANVSEVLADRMENILRIQARMDAAVMAELNKDPNSPRGSSFGPNAEAIDAARSELAQLQYLLRVLGVRMQVDMLRAELYAQVNSDTPAPALRVLIRAVDLCASEMQVIDLALTGPNLANQPLLRQAFQQRRDDVNSRLMALTAFLEELSQQVRTKSDTARTALLAQIPQRMNDSIALTADINKLADESTQGELSSSGETMEAKVMATVDKTIALSDRLLEKGPDGWEEIVLDHDEALLTALVQRLDLMNQRGDMADAWRQIKLAGDDLRSIMNLQATQVIRTDSNNDDPFNFTFDDSETRLGLSLDTPLNRRLQRNNFRVALINYNVGLRNLMAAEDTIKLDVREDLRQLALDRNQYTIAVASAALAYERVISTSMRLQLGIQNVAARDFLEAQQAYTAALSSIARQHVNYITDRLELFFDLEAFDVDNCGYWVGVHGDYAPQMNTDFPGTNPKPYDRLPPRVRYSDTIRSMESIPPGTATAR